MTKRRSSRKVKLTTLQKVLMGKGMMANRKERIQKMRRTKEREL